MARRISFNRIFQVALEHGWDGRTATMRSANTNTPASLPVVRADLAQAFGAASDGGRPFFSPPPFDTASLRPVSWLSPGFLLRGELTVIAGQGGGAKTALCIHVATALAGGRRQAGPFSVDNGAAGLRVALISAEEDRNRLGLLIAAASRVLALDATERALVAQNLLLHDAAASGWRLGAPRPGQREEIAPEAEDRSLNQLIAALTGVDLLILDTLSALFALPNENDNQAVTVLMRRMTKAARNANCAVLLLHHTAKLTRETAATQRGEATLVRGGGAIANSARVVTSLTALPSAEAAQFAILGLNPDRVRRLEHVKLNDAAPMNPAHFMIRSEPVKVDGGSEVAVRAIEFIAAPAASAAGISDAERNIAMKCIDAGTLDEHGARVALSPGGGRDNRRDAITHVARALMNGSGVLTEPQAKHRAREVLKDLRDRIGCVAEVEEQLPRYKIDGQRDGTRKGKGLRCNWHLAPWANTPNSEQQCGENA